jgi:V/A-type H+-transporting ATPase subunit E
MTPVDGNMDMLSKAVLSEAHAEAAKILADARAKADSIRQDAQQQADAQKQEILTKANLEAERIRRQSVATAQIDARTKELEHREKLLNQVFEKTRQQLPGIVQWNDYEGIAIDLVREAIQALGASKVRLYADDDTNRVLTKKILEKTVQDLKIDSLEVGGPLKQGKGVILETLDGRRRYDNTLETRLNRMQDSLRASVYHILMGESL